MFAKGMQQGDDSRYENIGIQVPSNWVHKFLLTGFISIQVPFNWVHTFLLTGIFLTTGILKLLCVASILQHMVSFLCGS